MFEFEATFANYARVLGGLILAVAVFIFLVGVFQWLTAINAPQQAEGGQRLMGKAVVAVALVGLSWIAIEVAAAQVVGSKIDLTVPTPIPPTPTPEP